MAAVVKERYCLKKTGFRAAKWHYRVGSPPCLAYGYGASYRVCGKNSSCSWHHSDTTNSYKSVTSRKYPIQTPVACIPLTPNHCRLRSDHCVC
ncbi:hypothetical protein AVEN_110128-1 [Araneus ventricosus]|uniref:Uncharacterized protein n=1 Tax=Araneus ventricosus TaxID=182803 RepID=A0A4Y2J1I2_ARAVE|nr:hypothetical protein AVEN_110128-1 [Araneus ventricosus]